MNVSPPAPVALFEGTAAVRRVRALHELPFRPRSRSRLSGLALKTRTSRRTKRFMVPGRVQKTVGAFHDRNSQTRMTNDEIRRNDQTRMDETGDCATQSIWTFELRISFVIRHSSFNDICKSGSWSQCMRKKRKGAFHESPIPFGIPLRMKEYNVRRVGLGVRNLFRSGGGRTEVRAPRTTRRTLYFFMSSSSKPSHSIENEDEDKSAVHGQPSWSGKPGVREPGELPRSRAVRFLGRPTACSNWPRSSPRRRRLNPRPSREGTRCCSWFSSVC